MAEEIQNETSSNDSDKELVELARRRFKQSEDAEREIRRQALDDIKFISGDQWDEEVKNARRAAKRPIFSSNRMHQFVRQIANDQRQNRPSIKVNPVDDKADKETAAVLQGLIRHIEYDSNADAAYDTGFKHAVSGGFGWYRITTAYCDESSFNQKILIKTVSNPFSCRLDPSYQEPDGSDANWGFCHEDLSKDEYESQYGESELCNSKDWDAYGDTSDGWINKDTARVAEYFYKEFRKVKLYDVNGKAIEESDLPKDFPKNALSDLKQRTAVKTIVHWVKMNGIEVLEKTIWPGKWIPIIPILGDEVIVDGKRILEGAIRHAKDSQKLFNLYLSNEAEAIALAPKAPFIGPAGSFKGFEKKWLTANTQNHAFLEYNFKTKDGKPLPPPQRNFGEPNIGAISTAKFQSADDMKASIGIFDASLGDQSNEVSGVAIQRRNMQAQTSNFHFVDNLSRSIKHGGRQIVDLIPKIYDTEQAIRIIGEDNQEKIVMINQVVDPVAQNSELESYDLINLGKYDVAVDVGPSFQTKRQEAVESLMEFMRVAPIAAPLIMDLVAKNMDWSGASEIADRLKKALPQNILDSENSGEIPPQLKGQLDQQMQMIEALTQQLNVAQQKIDTKILELESKERIELLKAEVELKKELLKQDAQDSREILYAQMQEIDARQAANDRAIQLDMKQSELAARQSSFGPSEQQIPTGGIPPGTNMGSF